MPTIRIRLKTVPTGTSASIVHRVKVIGAGVYGLSNYQLAINNGFEGTLDEWLATQGGPPGADGAPGGPGSNGLSAYQIAVVNGFVGTEEEWLASLEVHAGVLDATYLVATGDGTLTSEVVVGTSPGGELQGSGSSWAAPKVSAAHANGQTHAQVQAAAEQTAANALAAVVSGLGTAAGAALDTDTALAANSDTRVATQKAVKAAIAAAVASLVNSAPGLLDTLAEIDAAIGNDPTFATTMTTALAGKQPLNTNLTVISGLTPTNDDVLQRKAGAWINRTMAQLKTDLTLVKGDVGLGSVVNGLQLLAADLDDAGTLGTSTSKIPTQRAVKFYADAINTALTASIATKVSVLARTAEKTANYTASVGDLVPANATGGTITITLPTGVADKARIGVTCTATASTNVVNIAASGSDVFGHSGGPTTIVLYVADQGVTLQYDAANSVWSRADQVSVAALDARYAPIASSVGVVHGSHLVFGDGTSYNYPIPTALGNRNPGHNIVKLATGFDAVYEVLKNYDDNEITVKFATDGAAPPTNSYEISFWGHRRVP